MLTITMKLFEIREEFRIRRYLKGQLKVVNKEIDDILNDYTKDMSPRDRELTSDQLEILIRYKNHLKESLNNR